MSLGLPSHLSIRANARAIAVAARWAGLVCLGAAFINVVIAAVGSSDPFAWLAILALVPMVALLIMLGRRRTVALTIAYLAVGAACTFLYVLTLLTTTPSYHDTNLFVIALPMVAMTLVGGTGTAALAGILWATVGFALAETAVFAAAAIAGRTFRTDALSLGAYLLLIGVLTFDALTRGSRGRTQSAIHRAVRDMRLIDLRRGLIADSTAELHDTVLSELLAIAGSEPGPLSPRLRERIEADLVSLGRDRSAVADDDHREDWYESELLEAIELARDEGLTVDLSGERGALGRLNADRRRALGLATRQCLVNVLRHSGSATAEVAISSSGDAVTVMVVDGGHGFAISTAADDRLGLRQSVHDRIERVGGRVTIYSSQDVGTTVMLAVPIGDQDEALAS